MPSWVWWLGQVVLLVAPIVLALILTRRSCRAYRRAETDWFGLFGSMTIGLVGGAMAAWLVGMSWWLVADMNAFFATYSFRLFARPLR
jgi:hypothetical protein